MSETIAERFPSPACGPFDLRSGGQGEGVVQLAPTSPQRVRGSSPHPDPLPHAGEGDIVSG